MGGPRYEALQIARNTPHQDPQPIAIELIEAAMAGMGGDRGHDSQEEPQEVPEDSAGTAATAAEWPQPPGVQPSSRWVVARKVVGRRRPAPRISEPVPLATTETENFDPFPAPTEADDAALEPGPDPVAEANAPTEMPEEAETLSSEIGGLVAGPRHIGFDRDGGSGGNVLWRRRPERPARPSTTQLDPREASYLRIYETYPRAPHSLRRGRDYEVVLRICVSLGGQVAEVHIEHGASPDLDRAVVDAVRTWRYQPRLVGGIPTNFCHRMKLAYSRG